MRNASTLFGLVRRTGGGRPRLLEGMRNASAAAGWQLTRAGVCALFLVSLLLGYGLGAGFRAIFF
jgi:hypothetical protein